MKKNIIINISGVIFYLEEDAYETLQSYLDSIARYFSTFEGSKEIAEDIENRIAEIFASKLVGAKQALTAEDVQAVIRTMGSVKDFQAAGENEEYKEPPSQAAAGTKRTLFRDEERKILGGVCAGIGRYFNIDPLWPRMAMILFALAWGVGIVIYLALWFLLPPSPDSNEAATRKIFRNPDGKIIAGVAGGLAAYLGMEPIVMRLIFVGCIFLAGTGVVIYVFCWIFLSEAKTITDKMNMKGQPLTLNNIESSIKNLMRESDKKEESALAAAVLFPFRLMAAVLNGLTKMAPLLCGIFEVARVIVGFVVAAAGLVLIIAVLAAAGAMLGLFPFFYGGGDFSITSFPVPQFLNAIGGWTIFFAALTAFIPALLIFLLGISILTKRLAFSNLVGWILAGLLIIGIIFLSVLIPRLAMNFKEKGEYVIEKTFDPGKKTIAFQINETGWDDYPALKISFSGYEGDKIKLTQRFEAKGSTRKEAIENAKRITYVIAQKDSLLILDSNITFPKEAKFNAQELRLEFLFPYRVKFRLPKEMRRLMEDSWDGMSEYDNDIFEVTKFGLISLAHEKENTASHADDGAMSGFDDIQLSGAFNVKILQGNTYNIFAKGKISQYYALSMDGETLHVTSVSDPKQGKNNGLSELVITMPLIEGVKADGAGRLTISGFDLENFNWEINGAINAVFDGKARSMDLQCEGSSAVELKGTGEEMNVEVLGASRLNAYSYQAEFVKLEVRGVSSAEVYASKELKFEKDDLCTVRCKGSSSLKE